MTIKTKVDFQLFGSSVIVCVGELDDLAGKLPATVFKDFQKTSDEGGYWAACVGYTEDIKDPICTVYIHLIPTTGKKINIGHLSHESVHATSCILEAIGNVADHRNDEVFAYMVQHICETVSKALRSNNYSLV